jgi:hypothetical protein
LDDQYYGIESTVPGLIIQPKWIPYVPGLGVPDFDIGTSPADTDPPGAPDAGPWLNPAIDPEDNEELPIELPDPEGRELWWRNGEIPPGYTQRPDNYKCGSIQTVIVD